MSETQQDVDNGGETDYVADTSGDNSVTEDRARSLGWKPEEEFSGDPTRWTDANTFLEVHERNNGALRKANEKLVADMAEMKANFDKLSNVQKKIYEQTLKKAKEEHENQVAFLKASKREALRAGNHEMAAELDEQLDDVRAQGPAFTDEPEQKTTPAEPNWRDNPKLVQFVDRNPWIETDDDLADFVVTKANRIKKTEPNISLEDLLDQAVDATKRAFPQKFGATNRKSTVEGSTPGVNDGNSRGQAKTYQAMPKAARDMCDQMVRDRDVPDAATYVKMYWENQ